MAVVKPLKPTVNFEEAWKELKGILGRNNLSITIFSGSGTEDVYINEEKMNELEKKYKNIITIKRHSDNEMVDYCIKKSVEAQMENIHLRKKLREMTQSLAIKKRMNQAGYYGQLYPKKPERKLFKVHLVCVTGNDLQFVFDWNVTGKKREYLDKAFREREEISWHGLKMRIVEFNISISPPGVSRGEDKETFHYDKSRS